MTMKKLLYIIPLLAIAAIVVIKLKNNKKIAQDKVYQYNKEQAVNVQADTLRFVQNEEGNFFTGTFEPDKETKLSAEAQGKINMIYVDAGTIVKKGQTLLKLDDALLRHQLQGVEVQVEGLEDDVRRYTILANAEAIQGVQLEKAVLALKAAKIQRNTLQEQINKTAVSAPFNGVITQKFTEVGAFASPGIPLLQLTDIRQLRFTVNVPESDLNLFRNSQTYPVQADAYPEVNFSGKTILIGSKGNTGNSFPIQFLVSNTADLKIKSGMFGRVLLKTESGKESLIIPASAIIGSGSQPQVYIIKEGKAQLQNITVSNRIQNRAVISAGLNEGDVIITGGFINLFNGANVIIK